MKSFARLVVAMSAASVAVTAQADRIPDTTPQQSTGHAIAASLSVTHSLVGIAELSPEPSRGRLRAEAETHARPTAELANGVRSMPAEGMTEIISLAAAEDTGTGPVAPRSPRHQAAAVRAIPALASEEAPVPAGWMMLLCGILVMAFMASRKSGGDPD